MKIVTPCGWHSCSIVSTGWDTTRLLLDLHWVSFFRKQKQDTEKAVVPRFIPVCTWWNGRSQYFSGSGPVLLSSMPGSPEGACGSSLWTLLLYGLYYRLLESGWREGVYSCPQCRQAFTPRPVLNKNTILAEMVEKLGKTTLQPAASAGPGDVECNVCTGRKGKAVKSCLMCMNSYCQVHLEQHENFFKDKKHHLMEATERLQQMICKTHDRPLEVFCQTDQECICMMCMLDKHKNHKTRTAAAERTEKQVWTFHFTL